MELYIVEGEVNTDLEGMIFAVCTTEEKAKKAAELLWEGGEDLQITKITADSIISNGEIINVA